MVKQEKVSLISALEAHANVKRMQEFIDSGSDVNECEKGGWTPLMIAVPRNDLDIVKLLIDKGADVNARNEEGQTPLMRATSNNADIKIVQPLHLCQ